ncbi:hypothetical protein VFPPC_16230 [Pochonia chlamydosporia 170]|uniref:Uncharacterized protein n=1 Tax=Pochonia chlamydosporia 170 TaxID=1380566 RepID=A0A179FG91_METCM|nr:hypothetical protein VFPPC_16230 [Pochonia chlamydosporia 170]OAQ64554.1 hypothetical protein VFPPC_16230 [Pochonia chlamydosporia 170]
MLSITTGLVVPSLSDINSSLFVSIENLALAGINRTEHLHASHSGSTAPCGHVAPWHSTSLTQFWYMLTSHCCRIDEGRSQHRAINGQCRRSIGSHEELEATLQPPASLSFL